MRTRYLNLGAGKSLDSVDCPKSPCFRLVSQKTREAFAGCVCGLSTGDNVSQTELSALSVPKSNVAGPIDIPKLSKRVIQSG